MSTKILLNTYWPLCSTKFGIDACQIFGLLPFVDGSCRREPDFESRFPSISALCRGRAFAPRLKVGDKVIYLTVKGNYLGEKIPHYRMVAVLEVLVKCETHTIASQWYIEQNIATPSNCLIPNNPPLPIYLTIGDKKKREQNRLKEYIAVD